MITTLLLFHSHSSLRVALDYVIPSASSRVNRTRQTIEYVDGSVTYLKVVPSENEVSDWLYGMQFDSVLFADGMYGPVGFQDRLRLHMRYSAPLSKADRSILSDACRDIS